MSHGPDTGYGFPADTLTDSVPAGRVEFRETDGDDGEL